MEQTFKPLIDWQRQIYPPQERTIARLGSGLMEEVNELTTEIFLFDGSEQAKKKVAGEAIDVIFRSVGVVKEMIPNVSIDLLAKEKIDHTVNKKYPIKEIKKYVSQGLTPEQAMSKRKSEFAA